MALKLHHFNVNFCSFPVIPDETSCINVTLALKPKLNTVTLVLSGDNDRICSAVWEPSVKKWAFGAH